MVDLLPGKHGDNMTKDFSIYKGKRILVTGHTGFKGSWISRWLSMLEAEVFGYALSPDTELNLFEILKNDSIMESMIGDIRNYQMFRDFIEKAKPDLIFHMAAQPLVRESYLQPKETWETNVNGTINLLESVRELGLHTDIIVITSDKCYHNNEWIHGYRENDPIGGYDPYSSSKGATELVVSSWRNSFFHPDLFESHGVKLASVRAGNVIGGGDWAKDRIIPDCIRSLESGKSISVRNPYATRPWQHVLESLGGYLLLGESLLSDSLNKRKDLCSAFNFGPYTNSNKKVEILVTEVLKHWPGQWQYDPDNAFHEAFLLNLSIDKASQSLGWSPVWNFETTIEHTVKWYRSYYENAEMGVSITENQIKDYQDSLIRKITL